VRPVAEIVGGFLIPHDPLIAVIPDAPEPRHAESIARGMEHVATRLRALDVDTVITIGDDHYGMFGPGCIPACLIGIGDVEGPLEPFLGFARAPIPNSEELAAHILRIGFDAGIGWSYARSLVVDHSCAVPYYLCYRHVPGVRMIPIYLNDGVAPYVPVSLARRIGESIREAVRTHAGAERVAVIGTGGWSHWVGAPEMGSINEVFDAQVNALIAAADIDGLAALSDATVLATAGNGALEFRNWICAMAALGATRGDLLSYDAVPAWVSGLGFAELHARQLAGV
jgi:protocatechuate 4,5-dioxygenase beta chain